MQPDCFGLCLVDHFMLIRQFRLSRGVISLLVIYTLTMLLLDVAGGDIWLATKLYNLQGQQWLLRDFWLTEDVLHKGARQLNYVLVAAVLLTALYYRYVVPTKRARANAYLALFLALISAFATVAWLKAITNVSCPWHLSLFGGAEPYVHLFQPKPAFVPYQKCFPAGHASVGYAWVALYYFFAKTHPKYRCLGLAIGLAAGMILGFTQQLRGAHFLSHDLTTLCISLCCAKFCFALFNAPVTQKNSPT